MISFKYRLKNLTNAIQTKKDCSCWKMNFCRNLTKKSNWSKKIKKIGLKLNRSFGERLDFSKRKLHV